MAKNYGETIALLEWADRKMNEKSKSKTPSPKKDKDPDVVSMLMEQINKGEEAKKVIELLSKGLKKEDKKDDKDKNELTVLQKTIYVTLSALVGVPLYVVFLMTIGAKMAEMVK